MKIPERVYQRIIRWADRDEATGCLVSRYSVASHGYAQIGWVEGGQRIVTLCHRALWRYLHGELPPGVTVDHLCKNRRCVEAEHLRALPNLENARRTSGRDWPVGGCVNGHGPEHWRAKRPGRAKGYCHVCRMRIQRRRRAAAKASR